jgi:flagellar motor switch protein FliN/FliY
MDQAVESTVPETNRGADLSLSLVDLLRRIDAIADVPLPIDVELDRKTLSVRTILSLAPGSLLKLSRSAGENIDIRIGGSLVGFGEIVILEDSTGIRITDFWGEG